MQWCSILACYRRWRHLDRLSLAKTCLEIFAMERTISPVLMSMVTVRVMRVEMRHGFAPVWMRVPR